jgi:hypothetical protein
MFNYSLIKTSLKYPALHSMSVGTSVLYQKYFLYDLPLFSNGCNLLHVQC